MKFTPEEFRNYFESAERTILQPDMEKLKSNEFSEVCLDLVLAARDLRLLELLTLDQQRGVFSAQAFAESIVEPYFCALGVVAASPFLPQRDYKAALEQIGDLLDHPRHFSLVRAAQKGFQVKVDALGLNANSLKTNADEPFTPSSAGFYLASKYATLGDVVYVANNAVGTHKHVEQLCVFMEQLEKTRDHYPEWDDNANFFKLVFSNLAETSTLGRKDPSIAKILRLVNDGAPIVSVDECVTATEEIYNGLIHDERGSPEAFKKNLDKLDDHGSFYEIAFQSKFLELNRGDSFMDRGFQNHSPEGRVNFARNLQELAQRLKGRVADPKIVLAGFLLGTSEIDALTLKDRAQGNPQWLEHAILDKSRDPGMLRRFDSSLSVVLFSLLKGADTPQKKAFWDSRPEAHFIPSSYEPQIHSR